MKIRTITAISLAGLVLSFSATRNTPEQSQFDPASSLVAQLNAQPGEAEQLRRQIEQLTEQKAQLQAETEKLARELEELRETAPPPSPLFTPQPISVPIYFARETSPTLIGTLHWNVVTNAHNQTVWMPRIVLPPGAKQTFTTTVTRTEVVEKPVERDLTVQYYYAPNYPYPIYYFVPRTTASPGIPSVAPQAPSPPVRQFPPPLPRAGAGRQHEQGFPPPLPRAGMTNAPFWR